jgi:hypothetical protein
VFAATPARSSRRSRRGFHMPTPPGRADRCRDCRNSPCSSWGCSGQPSWERRPRREGRGGEVAGLVLE